MKSWYPILAVFILISMLLAGQPVRSSDLSDDPIDTGQPTASNFTGYLAIIRKRQVFPSIFGIEKTGYPEGLDVSKMREAGGAMTRTNAVLWAEVEPNEGERQWGTLSWLDTALAQYAASQMKVLLIVRKTPAWAQKVPGSVCGPVKDSKLYAFANFMKDLVARYSQPGYPTIYWEIWNEPDVYAHTSDWVFGCWGDPNDSYYGGGYYATMLKWVYPAIKSVNPAAQVLIGGLLLDCNPNDPPKTGCLSGKFFEGILRNGGGKYYDGVSFHAYDYYLSNYRYQNANWKTTYIGKSILQAKLEFLKGVAAKYQVTGKYFINSETALMCTSTCDGGFQATKAYIVAKSYAEAIIFGLGGNIWYDLNGAWRYTGLLDGYSVLPAYTAYIQSNRELATAKYVRTVNQPGVQGYEFKTSERRVWVLWSSDGAAHAYAIDGVPYAVLDVYGNPLPYGATVTVGQSPVYVRWVP